MPLEQMAELVVITFTTLQVFGASQMPPVAFFCGSTKCRQLRLRYGMSTSAGSLVSSSSHQIGLAKSMMCSGLFSWSWSSPVQESKPMPSASNPLSSQSRCPVRSSRASERCASDTPDVTQGLGGKWKRRGRGHRQFVRSVALPSSRSSMVNAAKRLADTPCPVKPWA